MADAVKAASNKTSSAVSAVHGGGLISTLSAWGLGVLAVGWVAFI